MSPSDLRAIAKERLTHLVGREKTLTSYQVGFATIGFFLTMLVVVLATLALIFGVKSSNGDNTNIYLSTGGALSTALGLWGSQRGFLNQIAKELASVRQEMNAMFDRLAPPTERTTARESPEVPRSPLKDVPTDAPSGVVG